MKRRGFVTSEDFKHLRIDRRRWVAMRWIARDVEAGVYLPGTKWLDLESVHPRNYQEIDADWEEWKTPEQLIMQTPEQKALL